MYKMSSTFYATKSWKQLISCSVADQEMKWVGRKKCVVKLFLVFRHASNVENHCLNRYFPIFQNQDGTTQWSVLPTHSVRRSSPGRQCLCKPIDVGAWRCSWPPTPYVDFMVTSFFKIQICHSFWSLIANSWKAVQIETHHRVGFWSVWERACSQLSRGHIFSQAGNDLGTSSEKVSKWLPIKPHTQLVTSSLPTDKKGKKEKSLGISFQARHELAPSSFPA